MRTLKYRAYIKPLKRYAEKYETILSHHQCNMEPSWTVNISPEEYYGDEDLVIEQFTGLLDRNSKEIYENDIVKDGEDEIYNQVVWFSQVGGFRIAPSRKTVEFLKEQAPEFLTKGEAVGWFITDDVEVVGNIHENPELVGEVDDEA